MIKFFSDQTPSIDLSLARDLIRKIRSDPMGGWFDLPLHPDSSELTEIRSAAQKIHSDSKFLVCIGIGGSYLGHRALIDALNPSSPTKILYTGNSLSTFELQKVLDTLGDSDFSINVISKSGTTTEPAVAFRILKSKLISKYGTTGAAARIYATTDSGKGALHDEAVAAGYTRFVVPDNIGGRYSVFSAVGLLPLAVAGVDISELLSGAASERSRFDNFLDSDSLPESFADDPILRYAFLRAELLQKSYDVEVLATFEPRFCELAEWWKQLFGESEGKDGQGIFPAAVTYTTDLHSLGQYLQDGRRNIFETILGFTSDQISKIFVPSSSDNLDSLAYLEGKSLAYINEQARLATISAHRSGGIPVNEIILPDSSAHSLGALIFFFEVSCALSALLSHVNPFDQPGVEAYKTNMFRLLGKPGFES